MEKKTGYKCQDCDTIIDPDDGSDLEVPLYECNSCGTVFNRDNSADGESHRCPDCNKFGAKLADKSCPACQEGQIEEITIQRETEEDEWEESQEDESSHALMGALTDDDYVRKADGSFYEPTPGVRVTKKADEAIQADIERDRARYRKLHK